MAFPVVESVTQTSGDAGGTRDVDVDLPATINSGDLLILLVTAETLTTGSWATPSGWTLVQQGSVNGVDAQAIFYKTATGSETSPVNLDPGGIAADGYAGQVFRISGWEGTSSGIAAASSVGGSANQLDPPASPSMTAGNGDNLFIAVALLSNDGGTVSAASTNYTDLVNTVSAPLGANTESSVATWRRELASASDDPGLVNLSTSQTFETTTIVVAGGSGPTPPPIPPIPPAPPPAPSPIKAGHTSLVAGVSATLGNGAPRTSGFYALVANVGPAAIQAATPQIVAATAVSGDLTVPSTSQMVALVAYGTGIREDNSQRAWQFDMDAHLMYVLSLGTQGTWVYDLTMKEVYQWGTEGFPIWNAERGTMWGDRIVAADFQTPQIYELVFGEELDEGFRAVRRKVTGILPSSSRDFTSVNMLAVDASIGDGQTDFAGTAELTIKFSDDQGQSYYTFDTITVSSDDDSQELLFHSLGAFNRPGRVIVIEDLGGPVRIGGADVWLEQDDG